MPKGEKPRSEPEIIPPDRADRRMEHGRSRSRTFFEARGTERIYVARMGPLGVVLAMLMAGIMLAVFFTLLLGAFLIWLPLVVLFIAGALIAGFLRAYFRRTP